MKRMVRRTALLALGLALIVSVSIDHLPAKMPLDPAHVARCVDWTEERAEPWLGRLRDAILIELTENSHLSLTAPQQAATLWTFGFGAI